MTPAEQARWRRAKEIFEAACDAPASGQRRIVEEMAGDDAALAVDVRRLLEMQAESGLTLDSPAQPLGPGMYAPGELLSDRYRVDRYLASGGMGDVYAATDERTGSRVAVKFVRPFAASQSDMEARFMREVRLAQKIDHPNVCRMRALEIHNGVRYCVMELLEGETLSDRLARGKMTVEEALPLARQVCEGLEAAHQAGVLHRDIKPGNVFLVGERALLIDFGLAAAVQREGTLTSAGVVIGTLAYVAPEQLESGKASAASDVYSLGVVLYEMLTGRKPHDAKSPFRLARQKAAEMHDSISQSKEMPAVWAEVLTRCLKARPEQRYQSAAGVRVALERGRPSVRFRASKPWVWLPSAVALAAVVLGTGWNWGRRDYEPAAGAARLYEEGASAMAQSSPARAVELLVKAVAMEERFVKARALLAVAHAETDQSDKARQAILEATMAADRRWLLGRGERYSLDGARAAVVRDFVLAAEQYGKWAEVARGHERGNALLFRGRMLDQAGKADEALASFEEAVREEPGNASARIRLASQLCRRLRFPAAAEHFRTAERMLRAEGNLEGLTELLMARAALQTQSEVEQQKDVTEAEALSVRSGNRLHQLSVRFRQASMALASKDYEGAAAISVQTAEEARHSGQHVSAARAMGELGSALAFAHQYERAIPILREAMEMASLSGSYSLAAANRIRLGEALLSVGHREEAVATMKPAVDWYRQARIRNVLPLILIKYATAHVRQADAVPIYKEALDLAAEQDHKGYQAIALQRLTATASATDLRLAVEYSRRLLPLARSIPNHTAMFKIAEVFRDFGLVAEARQVAEELEKSLEQYPKGVDRDGYGGRLRTLHAEAAMQAGDCRTALGIHRSGSFNFPERKAHYENLGIRLEVCAPGTPATAMERHLRRLHENWRRTKDQQIRIQLAIAQAEIALRLKRWEMVRSSVREGLALSRDVGYPLFQMNLMMLERAAERQVGNTSAADRLTGETTALARQVGYDAGFNGRKDLQALWRAGSE